MADFQIAMANRSLTNIKTELQFLADSDVISSQQLQTILGQLPASASQKKADPLPATMGNLSISDPPSEKKNYYQQPSEKQNPYEQPSPSPAPPPPAYSSAAPLCNATALYQYSAQDTGDLALLPNDRVQVTEYMNEEWWKGRSERTGQEGIFPRSYIRVEEKSAPAPSNYGNVPMDVTQGAHGGPAKAPGQGSEMGKKFGKKLGNAAIFGAGATVGSKIVNGIF